MTTSTRMGDRMNIRTVVIGGGFALIIALAAFNWINRPDGGGAPLKGADELSALPDDKLEAAVHFELGRAVYGDGVPADAWRSMNQQARHLWSVASISNIGQFGGLPGWLAAHSRPDASSPSPEEIRDGLAAMGLNEAQSVMDDIIAQRASTDQAALSKLHQRLVSTTTGVTAMAIRQTWVRDHLHDVIKR
jgi:hypothetical protein